MSNRFLFVTCSTLALLAGAAFGQSAKPSDKNADPVLKGPDVKETAAPGQTRKFSGAGSAKDRAPRELPPRMQMRAYDVLRGEKAAESVRLTADQESQLKAIQDEFRDSVTAYFTEHKDELTSLRGKVAPNERRRIDELLRSDRPQARPEQLKPEAGGRRGPRPDADPMKDGAPGDPMMDPAPKPDSKQDPKSDQKPDQKSDQKPAPNPEAEAARARLKEIADGAPKPADANAKMWNTLTEAQRPIVQKELDTLRADFEKRGAGGQGRPNGKPGEDPMTDQPKGQPKGEGTPNFDKLPPKLQERLKNMSPEEREKAIKEFQERRKADPKQGQKPGGKQDKQDPKANPPK